MPNSLIDYYLPTLSNAELKILLVIIRQTHGWIDRNTGKRKLQDRISHNQFIQRTGLSSRIISLSLQKLITKGFICAINGYGEPASTPASRKGNPHLFFSLRLSHFSALTTAKSLHSPSQKVDMYKTNYTKLNKTKLRESIPESLGDIVIRIGNGIEEESLQFRKTF